MVVDGAGRAYVGNFGFDLEAAMKTWGSEALMKNHVTAKLACVWPDGSVHVVAADMSFPNGSVITPDGKTLIVGESLGRRLTAFDIAADGALANRRVWAETPTRSPDGISLDARGAIWIANPLAHDCALIAEGGEVLDVIDTVEPCYACMLGGEDGRTLFMLTAERSITSETPPAPGGRIRIATVDAPRAGLP
jgi:sugar lactone lactonase YvrE